MSGSAHNLAVICVGGGQGLRFGSDKLAERLGRHTVFETTLLALQRAEPSAPLIAVCPEQRLPDWRRRLQCSAPRVQLVAGGQRRQDSVKNGVETAAHAGATAVLIHDAARPLIDIDDIRQTIAALGQHEGAMLCARVTDTVKRVAADGRVAETIPRDELCLAQTPQVLQVAALRRAWQQVDWQRTWTDEAAMLEATGGVVMSVLARSANPKITCRQDLSLVRALLLSQGGSE